MARMLSVRRPHLKKVIKSNVHMGRKRSFLTPIVVAEKSTKHFTPGIMPKGGGGGKKYFFYIQIYIWSFVKYLI